MTAVRMAGAFTRFATVEEVLSSPFLGISRRLDEITVRLQLPDHSDLNEERYPWSAGLLSRPAFYAARLWEYPFAILAAELRPGMRVADLGCGMTPFTVYLKDEAGCDVTGIDPDIFPAGLRYRGHGVSEEFRVRTGLHVLRGDMTAVPLETGSQDRVFCLSVMEHVAVEVRRQGMREIARILKPGGRAVVTVDMSMWFELNRPLDLVWESGLAFLLPIDLRWPARRLGLFSDSKLPADVMGLTLVKDDYLVETQYRRGDEAVPSMPGYLVPTLLPIQRGTNGPRWRRLASRLYRAMLLRN
jgi:SAM-dependent methyltransferase